MLYLAKFLIVNSLSVLGAMVQMHCYLSVVWHPLTMSARGAIAYI